MTDQWVQTRALGYYGTRLSTGRNNLCVDVPDFHRWIDWFLAHDHIAYDCETSGVQWWNQARICGFSLAAMHNGAPVSCYFPFRHLTGERQLPEDVAVAGLKRVLTKPDITLSTYNLKFERHLALREGGIRLGGRLRDEMIEGNLRDENEPDALDKRSIIELNDGRSTFLDGLVQHELKQLAKIAKLNVTDYKDVYGYAQLPLDLCAPYACEDVDVTLRLGLRYDALGLRDRFKETNDTEIALTEVICEVEEQGCLIDVPYLRNVQKLTGDRMAQLEPQIFSKCGATFDIGSTQQLVDVLKRIGVRLWKKTRKSKTGQLSTDYEALEPFIPQFPVVKDILDWKEAQKINGTYTESILKRLDKNNILHGDFKSLGTMTGRMSAEKPNMQNFPTDSDDRSLAFSGKKVEDGGVDPWSIKRAFILDEGWVRGCFDYSQIELRMLGFFAQDPTLLDVYQKGEDIHARTALEVFGEVTKQTRKDSKPINFGLVYGMSPQGYARQVKCALEIAEQRFKLFFERYPAVGPWKQGFVSWVRANGSEFTNTFGRPQHVQGLNHPSEYDRAHAERNCVSRLVQGTAAELMKLALVRTHEWEKKNNSGLKIRQIIHDDMQLDIPKGIAVEVARAVLPLMEDFPVFRNGGMPIVADPEVTSTSWAEKKKWSAVRGEKKAA